MTQNLLIAGYGYIGKRLLPLLKNYQVFTLSRSDIKPDIPHHKQHIIMNMDDELNTQTIPSELKINTIIVLLPPQNSGTTDQRIRKILNNKFINPENTKQFILISTTGVYGDCKGRWIDESEPVNPQADRARRRLDAEQQALSFCQHHQIELTILRVAGIYAEDKLPLESIRQGKPVINKKEAAFSNRIHAHDLCQICLKAIDEHHPGIYNCCDSAPSTMTDYFSGLAMAYGLKQPPIISLKQAKKELSAGMLSYLSESRRLSNKKLLEEFKLELKYPQLSVFLKEIKNQGFGAKTLSN